MTLGPAGAPTVSSGWFVAISATLILLLIGVFGYLSSLELITDMEGGTVSLGLMALALFTGVACFFNPCSIPVFPVLLTQIYGTGEEGKTARVDSFRLGVAGALGVLLFMGLFGLIVIGLTGVVQASFFKGTMGSWGFRVLRIVFGVVLAGLGVLALLGRGLEFRLPKNWRIARPGHPIQSMFAYGFVYTLLGLGCTAPILGGLTLATVSAGSVGQAWFIYLTAALVMGLLMFATTFVVRHQRRVSGPFVNQMPRVLGIVFIVVGAYVALEAMFPAAFVKWLHPWVS